MDLIKIGKFIASLRKEAGLTQEELAEKLYVTDRAVSKWERGICLPDASKMIDLSNILGINPGELLMGEKINMEDYSKKTEELLVEMARKEEANNKQKLINMFVLLGSTLIFYLGIILLAAYTLGEGALFGTIVCVSTALLVVIFFYGFKIEIDTGYYECRHCHHRFTYKNYFKAFISMHVHTTRYIKCPNCHKRTWAKKVMTKE